MLVVPRGCWLSLSARRAWIEITSRWRVSGRALVALRKESVDRNARGCWLPDHSWWSLSARRAWIEMSKAETAKTSNASLSARRAWIEISGVLDADLWVMVALRKESVDRNLIFSCRSM